MTRDWTPLPPLGAAQLQGTDPAAHAWVSASAGSGKTQLLTARILRLLLAGAHPERCLALTFTKAGATEMQERVLGRLMGWAGADDPVIAADLVALGLEPEPALIARARTLFASALDARGGLKVQTIHAFAASLLKAFPLEAGVPPAFETLDDRAAHEIEGQALDRVLARAGADLLADFGELAVRHGESGLVEKLGQFRGHEAALAAFGPPPLVLAQVRRALGLPGVGSADAIMAEELARIDEVGLMRLAGLFEAHGGSAGPDRAAAIREWLRGDPARRAVDFDSLAGVFLTQEGMPRKKLALVAMCNADSGCEALAARLQEDVVAAHALKLLLDCAEVAAVHIRAAQALAAERAGLKADLGALSYDDLIARTAALLRAPGAAEWVRFKLDQRIDHILVDEAQDTNRAQWDIVEALADEFFAGEGAHEGPRTLFVVGDYKQAIFGFQGTDPAEFEGARARLRDRAAPVADVPLADNFRSAPAILAFVDRLIADAGAAALGLKADVPAHRPYRATAPGRVTLWKPVASSGDDEDDGGERGWVPTAKRMLARRIAEEVSGWLERPLILPARGRAVRAEDILILVRTRGEFVPALVAALGQAGVPVAGADRLQLRAPIAARDILSLIRFVLQPDDDLSLGEVLVSPFVGLSQELLFSVAAARPGTLWQALRESREPAHAAAARWLGEALRIADFMPPHRFLEQVLSLPVFSGRSRMLARLGADARDVLDEMVNAALRYEADHAPSLEGFLHWLEAGEVDVKRDPAAPRGEVRVMTVHGAKGLQAPVVILADAAADERADRSGHVPYEILEGHPPLPLFHNGAKALRGRAREAADARAAREAEEEMRLLYVATTRAEDMLFIGGALTARRKDGTAAEASWWGRAARAVAALGGARSGDDRWGEVLTHAPGAAVTATPTPPAPSAPAAPLPDWATRPAPPEVRPSRPLAPSRLEPDDAPRPPGPPDAARRGRLVHRLLERAPMAADAAARWLGREAPDLGPAERDRLLAEVRRVIEDPAHAALFGPDALPEAALAAVVGEHVVAGRVDRLLVEPGRVLVVDFKSGPRIPASAAAIPAASLAQMALYAEALKTIFPDRRIEAALLYVSGPLFYPLPPALLAAHLPAGACKPAGAN